MRKCESARITGKSAFTPDSVIVTSFGAVALAFLNWSATVFAFEPTAGSL